MPFTVRHYHDLVRLLREHPEWREELRNLLLTEDLLALPRVMRDLASEVRALAEAQRRTEERVNALAEEVRALAEAQRRTEERVDALAEAQRRTEERVDALAEAQRKTEERVDALVEEVRALAEAQRRMAEHVSTLAEAHERLERVVGAMRGDLVEMRYREHGPSYFGRFIRRAKVIRVHEIEEKIEASLDPREYEDLSRLDLLIRGRLREIPGEPEVWLAIEVSATVDEHDVERAARRARLLKKAGFKAIPVAAGEKATAAAESLAQVERVVLVRDGGISLWDEAFEAWFEGEGR